MPQIILLSVLRTQILKMEHGLPKTSIPLNRLFLRRGKSGRCYLGHCLKQGQKPCTHCSATVQNRDHVGIRVFKDRKQGGEGWEMAKRRVKLPKLQEEKLRLIFFPQPFTRFTVITRNLDASKREGTFLYMQFGYAR